MIGIASPETTPGMDKVLANQADGPLHLLWRTAVPMRPDDDGPRYQEEEYFDGEAIIDPGRLADILSELEQYIQERASESGDYVPRTIYRPVRTLVGDRITELFGQPLRRDEEESFLGIRRGFSTLAGRHRHRRGDTEPVADPFGTGEDEAQTSDETLFDC